MQNFIFKFFIFLAVSSCKILPKEAQVLDVSDFFSDSAPDKFIDPQLRPIYEEFKKDLKKRSLRESNVELRVLKFDPTLKNRKGLSGECQKHRSKAPLLGFKSFNVIYIASPETWGSYKSIEPGDVAANLKLLVYHELGHCQLGKKHSSNKDDSVKLKPIMHESFSAIPTKNLEKIWDSLLDDYFKTY